MMEKYVIILWILHLLLPTQGMHHPPQRHTTVSGPVVTFDMMEDAFDDQYIGCQSDMDEEMENVMNVEKGKHEDLRTMWSQAEKLWKEKKKNIELPDGFKKEYGVALALYTMGGRHKIYKTVNAQLRTAGKSRDEYMNNFHFKALHYYVTRGLQLLKKDCATKTTVYRGATLPRHKVTPELRFGQFASSSTHKRTGEGFGKGLFFTIQTCFGADIWKISNSPSEREVLIPGTEKFRLKKQTKPKPGEYELESTGELCSYFNCAYQGNEKKKEIECRKP